MDDHLLIHPDRLSAKPVVFEGTFTPADLERLEDSLAGPDGELRYRITAGLDRQRRKALSCIIEGFVFLLCQSSLEPFRHEISISERIVLVDNETEQAAVRMMRQHRAGGLSLRAIAGALSQALIPTKQNGKWQANTVRKILAHA